MRILIHALALVSLSAHAKVDFECYTFPGQPVQAYEYTTGACGGKDPGPEQSVMGTPGVRPVLCMMAAVCRPKGIGPQEPLPDHPDQMKFQTWMYEGKLKSAQLLCKGEGTYDSRGFLVGSKCPEPTECQKDLFYSLGATRTNGLQPERFNIRNETVK